MTGRQIAHSPYMEWAKLQSVARFNLATSGTIGYPLAELGVRIDQLEINGPDSYGYEPLLQAIAKRYRVPHECVASAMGTSLANYLAMAATTEPGDEILVEQPTYDLLLNTARFLGLQIKRFQRRPETNFAVDLSDLERNLTPRTRLIVLCNLHNPSGALTPDSVIKQIASLGRKHGAYVLVDEVYREMLYEDVPGSAFHVDPEHVIVTNSLTKAYGVSGLRCGWVLAPPTVAKHIWQLHDLHSGTYPFPTEVLSVIAFEKLPQIAHKMKSLLERNRKLLQEFLESRSDLEFFWPEYGAIVFPRLRQGNVDDFCELLRREFETSVVPGRFFESADRFRVGVTVATETVRESLEMLGRGLDRYKSSLVMMSER